MDEPVFRLWSYLSQHPLTGLTATLIVYVGAQKFWEAIGKPPLLNPVLLTIIVIGGGLRLLGVSFADYFDGAQFIHVMLGPATVALAIPLYRSLGRIKAALRPVLGALLFGSLFGASAAVGLAALFGASRETLLSLAPKSTTTPVAMGVAEAIGGLPSLTAVLVILTGVVGASLGSQVMSWTGLRDAKARGFAMGLASHGIGAARAFQVSDVAGAFASLAMALNALATAALLPALAHLLMRFVAE